MKKLISILVLTAIFLAPNFMVAMGGDQPSITKEDILRKFGQRGVVLHLMRLQALGQLPEVAPRAQEQSSPEEQLRAAGVATNNLVENSGKPLEVPTTIAEEDEE